VRKAATFSDDRRYRYTLTRDWAAPSARRLVVIGLNPSTADENRDDPTITRLIRFAMREKMGGLVMVNLFAFRATDPKEMKSVDSPVDNFPHGCANDSVILAECTPLIGVDPVVVAAWGAHGGHLNRGRDVREMLNRYDVPVFHFGLTKHGFPKHPLYLPSDAPLTRWEFDAGEVPA
jgi:hypothetical protein